jgi:hypothetical protein
MSDRLERRRNWFAALSAEARENNAFVISVPLADLTVIECLPHSPWPEELASRGYPIEEIEGGQRILPFAVSTAMTISSSGALIPATEGSTRPVTMTHYGAGPVRTVRYSFKTPF